MKRIIAFGASNSTKSINKQLATWTGNRLLDIELNVLDLNDFEMPIYSPERQQEGFPNEAVTFNDFLNNSDGIIISFAEYNGSYAAAFKNIMDWVSRLDRALWSNKPMFLLATSPGGRGGKSVLETAAKTFPYMGGNVAASFSLPSFHQNFEAEVGIKDSELLSKFTTELAKFQEAIISE